MGKSISESCIAEKSAQVAQVASFLRDAESTEELFTYQGFLYAQNQLAQAGWLEIGATPQHNTMKGLSKSLLETDISHYSDGRTTPRWFTKSLTIR